MGNFIDLTGQKLGRLTVVERGANENSGAVRWVCTCDCGKTKLVRGTSLLRGETVSCGCFQKQMLIQRSKTHGLSKTATYRSWSCMISRCTSLQNEHYSFYGGRGIKICERWINSFENFLEDMGERPNGHTLDRVDVNGDYCPENCRWATRKQQANNMRTNVMVEHNGKQMTIAQRAEILGEDPKRVYRMRYLDYHTCE